MLQRQAMIAWGGGGFADQGCERLVTGGFGGFGRGAQGGGMAPRQPQSGQGSGVANHDAAHQVAQTLAVGGFARFAGHHVYRAELLLGFEDAGLEQGEQVVEFQEAVLHRGCREQEQEALLQAVDQLVAGAGLVAQVMRLVHDDDVVGQTGQRLGDVLASGGGDRGDHPGLRPEGGGVGAQQRVVAGGAVDAEFGRHFVPPLADQGSRGQDQDAFGHPAQDVFLQHHSGLDGLAETDLIGQQDAAAILLEDFADGFGLIPMRLDVVQRGQAEQFVEFLEQR